MKAALLAPLFGLFLTAAAISPTIDIVVTGRITVVSSGTPIHGAQITIVGTQRGAITGADGRYRLPLPGMAVGSSVRLRVQMIGFKSIERELQLVGDSIHVAFAMAPAPIELTELVVPGVVGGKAEGKIISERDFSGVGQVEQTRAAPNRGGEFNTESYARIAENEFYTVASRPLSTFSVDVDRASYSNIRRFINERKLPPRDAVRIEEMINYFPYSYEEPNGSTPFSVTTDLGAAPWQPRHHLLRIALQARRVPLDKLPPNNLVFLIDVSGSMQPANKLPLLKQALRLMVNELRPVDRVALVVYAGQAGLVLESTPADQKDRILDAIEALSSGGSTAGGAGLRLAYDVAKQNHLEEGNNRVILATDGDFNVGVSSDAEMVRLIEEKRQQGTFLTVLGFGMGNLKDSKLEQLADHGNGNYAYIDDLLEARKTLVSELGGTLLTVAKDVKIQVEFNPAKVSAYRLIGYENRLLNNEDFKDDKKDAGDIGAGHAVTALYEVIPAGVTGTADVRDATALRYQEPPSGNGKTHSGELAFVKLRYKQPNQDRSIEISREVKDRIGALSEDLRFAAAVAAYGMILRESPHRGNCSLERVLELAHSSIGADPGGYRREFVRLVQATSPLREVTDRMQQAR